MSKIMLVEDDKSLREIYGVRLLAEGYDIVSAGDGEEALAMAIKERPDLIVSDVMMPKISGFDMLDILRSTTETKNIKVIMMTALSSEDQRVRGESLGADRYLVKSQVGIEDVVRVVHEVLGDATAAAPAAAAPAPVSAATPVAAPAATPAPTPAPVQRPAPAVAPRPVTPVAPTPMPASTPVAAPAPHPVGAPIPAGTSTPKPPSLRSRTIEPLNDPMVSPININELLDKELAKEAIGKMPVPPPAPTPTPAEPPLSVTPPTPAPAPEPVMPPVPAPVATPVVPAVPPAPVSPTISAAETEAEAEAEPTSMQQRVLDTQLNQSVPPDAGSDDLPEISVSEDGTLAPELTGTELPKPLDMPVPPKPPVPPVPGQ